MHQYDEVKLIDRGDFAKDIMVPINWTAKLTK